jgi:transcriptional regulator with XRE-family HTH domain
MLIMGGGVRLGRGVARLPIKPKLDDEREELTMVLTRELPMLRTSLGLKQYELANAIGISRQGYNFFETLARPLPWSTFVPLFLYFETREASRHYMQSLGDFEERVLAVMSVEQPPLIEYGAERDEPPAAVCLYCGHRNPEGVKFCGECGTRIGEEIRNCAACGAEAKGGAKYCGNCGAKII